jgi:hypothetical protein
MGGRLQFGIRRLALLGRLLDLPVERRGLLGVALRDDSLEVGRERLEGLARFGWP